MGESDNKKLTTKLCRSGIHSTASRRKLGKLERCHGRTTRLLCSPMLLIMSDKGFATSSQCFNQLWLIFTRIVFGIPQSFWNQSSGVKLCILSRIMTGTPVSVSISVSLPLSRNNTCLAHCITLMQLQYTNSICWCWCSMHLMFATR